MPDRSTRTKLKLTMENKEGPKTNFVSGKGGRKTASAAVWLYDKTRSPVTGIMVNGWAGQTYFNDFKNAENKLLRPFQVTNTLGRFAVSVKALGGGKKSQLDATVLAIARALVAKNTDYKPSLRKEGLLTRDSRMVESKKWGRHKARRGQQYAKR